MVIGAGVSQRDWGAGSLGREEGGDGFCDGPC